MRAPARSESRGTQNAQGLPLRTQTLCTLLVRVEKSEPLRGVESAHDLLRRCCLLKGQLCVGREAARTMPIRALVEVHHENGGPPRLVPLWEGEGKQAFVNRVAADWRWPRQRRLPNEGRPQRSRR